MNKAQRFLQNCMSAQRRLSAPSEDQSMHPRRLVRVFTALPVLNPWLPKTCPVKPLTRLRACAGLCQSSIGIHAVFQEILCPGSYVFLIHGHSTLYTLTALVGRWSLRVGWENGPERGRMTVSFNL